MISAAGLNIALPARTRLNEYEVLEPLGTGGFGIVYRAFDRSLERPAAIKEYLPPLLATRAGGCEVALRAGADAEIFAIGLRAFVNEARLLAKFDHPSLVKVHRFWEQNGTAYMAMPLYEGRTLTEIWRMRLEMPDASPDEEWLRSLLMPLLGALELLHHAGVFHRDVAPDNILIADDGAPILLDFGAARQAVVSQTEKLTSIVKPRFAPIEQYAETAGMRQGAWTDLYALGATLHFLITGHAPAAATTRIVGELETPLAETEQPGISQEFLRVVDWMLAPHPRDRPQSVAELRDALDGRRPLPVNFGATVPSRLPSRAEGPESHFEMTQSFVGRYSRTAAGDAELRDPRLALSRPGRNLLSLIGPDKPGSDWLALIRDASEPDLRLLIAVGLIAENETPAGERPPDAALAPPAAGSGAQPAAAHSLETFRKAFDEGVARLNFAALTDFLTEQANSRFGLFKAFAAVLAVERCKDIGELRQRASSFADSVAGSEGLEAASALLRALNTFADSRGSALPSRPSQAPHSQQQRPSIARVIAKLDRDSLYEILTQEARPRLGVVKGSFVIAEVERCKTVEELRLIALHFVDKVRAAQGSAAAREFCRQLGGRLPHS